MWGGRVTASVDRDASTRRAGPAPASRPAPRPAGGRRPSEVPAIPVADRDEAGERLADHESGAPPAPRGRAPVPAIAPPLVHEALASGGQDIGGRARLHTGPLAAASAAAVGARAYTVGRDIVLGAPEAGASEAQVVAHELSHASRPQPVLHRYESGEHAQTGSTTRNVTINGVTLDEGTLIALGDFFEKPEDVYSVPRANLQTLADLVQRDRMAYTGQGPTTPVSNAEWEKATEFLPPEKRYLALASHNDPHFAPRAGGKPSPGGDYKSEWRKLHQQALETVIASTAAGKSGVPDEATVQNAFASHYLTDAFAAGHLLNKSDLIETAQANWKLQHTTGVFLKETNFTKAVAHFVLTDPGVAALMAHKELKLVGWGPVTEERFSELIWQMADSEPAFFNSFARLVHDQLNQGIDQAGKQVSVTNEKGDTWYLSGDETLSKSPKTLQVMQAAVAQSYRNLQAAAQLAQTPADFEPFFKAVWDYTPHPTAKGQRVLDEVARKDTDPDNPETPGVFSWLVISQIDTLATMLTDRGILRDKGGGGTGGAGTGGAGPGR